MKTYIINLKESADRRLSIAEQANASNLDYEFVDATNGRDIPENLVSILKKKDSYAVTPGEIGCALSHLTVYRKLLHSDNECVLILEDDVLIPEKIKEILSSLERNIKTDKPYVCLLSKVNQFNKKPFVNLQENGSVHEVYNATSACAYVINRKAAKNLLDHLMPVWCVADQWATFTEFGYIKLFGLVPACINTHPVLEEITTITDRKDSITLNEKRRVWDALRANRPLSVKIRKAFYLFFKRPFINIIKQ